MTLMWPFMLLQIDNTWLFFMVLLPEAIYYLLNQISDGSKRICPGPFETYHMLF